ncbi:MAG TPA: hypothetical protein VFS30_06420 [Dehalococcoidia bacterium]|nr:hypothetical protein [Dehalococcoidia bacterium]
MEFFRRMEPSTRSFLVDVSFILGTLVVALGAYYGFRAASGPEPAPRSDIAGVIATATATASPSVTATAVASPAAAPTSAATTGTAPPASLLTPPLGIDAALGRQETYVCAAGSTSTTDASLRRAVRSWNQMTAIWNRVVESEGALNAAIPSPFTLENAAASATFLSEARRHEGVVLAAIDELVALRAAGIHTRTREMSLRQGDFYDLERLTVQQTIAGVTNLDAAKWNGAASLEAQRSSYLETARAEMRAACAYLNEP